MNNQLFDPIQFYQSYPSKVIARPGYPARAAFKSTFMFSLYAKYIYPEIGTIKTYADIGGCFGFGANSMAFQISKYQGTLPRTVVFEISSDFVKLGSLIFPSIEFVESEFAQYNGDIQLFDLVSLFDVVEHVVNPATFLQEISARSKYVMLITPMETTGDMFGNKPPVNQGKAHVDGHVNFFTPRAYEKLLQEGKLDIIASSLIPTIVPSGTEAILIPELPEPARLLDSLSNPKIFLLKLLYSFPGIPWKLKRKVLGGGNHIALCRSQSFNP